MYLLRIYPPVCNILQVSESMPGKWISFRSPRDILLSRGVFSLCICRIPSCRGNNNRIKPLVLASQQSVQGVAGCKLYCLLVRSWANFGEGFECLRVYHSSCEYLRCALEANFVKPGSSWACTFVYQIV